MKRCLLIYFTGTFNTRYISKWLAQRLAKEGYEVTLYEIDPLKTEQLDYSGYDLVGFGAPIYGYNAPWPFLKFVLKQNFPKGLRAFIYKNSGETEHENDASSMFFLRKLRRSGVIVENEYHFIMPYNIHFRFDERLVREQLEMDAKLMEILVYEVSNRIPNIKKYKLWPRIVTFFVAIQFIGGDINSFLYKVHEERCTKCGLCVKQCPTKNIYMNKRGEVKFHHNCLMCMRCSLYCPTSAIDIGFLQGWKVNGRYNFAKIAQIENKEPVITDETTGFFKCYIETYNYINSRYKELFGDKPADTSFIHSFKSM